MFARILLLILFVFSFAFGQSKYLPDVNNHPRFLEGLTIRTDEYLKFRNDSLRIRSSSASTLQFNANGSFSFTGTNSMTFGYGFWEGCPSSASPDPIQGFHYLEDFIGTPLVVTTNALEGWKATGDASYVLATTTGYIGSDITITPVTGSNNEIYFQLGELGTENPVKPTKNDIKPFWFEVYMTSDAVTDAGNIMVGLAQAGSSASNFIADAGDDIADVSAILFGIWENNPDTVLALAQTAAGALDTIGVMGSITAGTFQRLGIKFDGAETVSFWKDGVQILASDVDDALFPDGIALSPIIGLKNGAADKTARFDYIVLRGRR